MPATYTYNDAIEDAASAVAHVLDEAGGDPVLRMHILLEVVGRLERLKRTIRRPRRASTQVPHDRLTNQEKT
jgi:hypothetical protein